MSTNDSRRRSLGHGLGRAVALATLTFACGAPAPCPREARPTASEVHSHAARPDPERVLAYVLARSLADEVGPRLAGSEGDRRAVAWATAKMQELGFANVHREAVKVPVWTRVREEARVLSPAPQALAVTALGWSAPTPPGGVEAEIVEVSSLADADALGDRARGKIVFYNVPTLRARDGHGYGQTVPVRFEGPTKAERAGAAAVLLRSVGTDDGRFPHTGSMGRGTSRLPTAAVSNADADLLHRLGQRGAVRVKLVVDARDDGEAESANVVGEIPGTAALGEVVLLGAHLDSWDVGTGAVDDAAGCGLVLAAASRFARAPLRRTVRVVLFAAEENSVSGGKEYARAHAAEADRLVMALEMDHGTGAPYETRVVGGPGAARALGPLAAALAAAGAPLSAEAAFGGTDVGPLRALGVPIVDVRQDASTYFDVHHTADDVPARLDPEGLAKTTRVIELVVAHVAGEPVDLGRVPEGERKPRH